MGHDGIFRQVTVKPGDMLFYESHSVIHGRSFPIVSRYCANICIHIEPNGYTRRNSKRVELVFNGPSLSSSSSIDQAEGTNISSSTKRSNFQEIN